MPNELARLFNTEIREHSKALDRIDRQAEEAQKRIGAIARTTNFAMLAGLAVTQTRNTAERICPDAAEKMALFDLASAMATANIIQGLGR